MPRSLDTSWRIAMQTTLVATHQDHLVCPQDSLTLAMTIPSFDSMRQPLVIT